MTLILSRALYEQIFTTLLLIPVYLLSYFWKNLDKVSESDLYSLCREALSLRISFAFGKRFQNLEVQNNSVGTI